MDLNQAVQQHVQLFNDAVRSGDFTDFAATFTDKAVMTFEDLPIGPFRGSEAIRNAYTTQPPTDTMSVWSIEETAPDTAHVRFDWDAGGSGSMQLRWSDDLVTSLTISFNA